MNFDMLRPPPPPFFLLLKHDLFIGGWGGGTVIQSLRGFSKALRFGTMSWTTIMTVSTNTRQEQLNILTRNFYQSEDKIILARCSWGVCNK